MVVATAPVPDSSVLKMTMMARRPRGHFRAYSLRLPRQKRSCGWSCLKFRTTDTAQPALVSDDGDLVAPQSASRAFWGLRVYLSYPGRAAGVLDTRRMARLLSASYDVIEHTSKQPAIAACPQPGRKEDGSPA
jgi:hypothetical protein